MEIEGQIDEIIYQNEMNGYTVASFDTETENITIVGYLPFINKGDSLKLIGKYITHPEYGEQFKIDTFEKTMPQTVEALQKYLSGGIIKGIGPVTAEKIIEKFGEDTINILKNEPKKLAQVKGITELRAMEIVEDFNEKWELWQIVGFLEKFGISAQNSKKVYEVLGKDAIEKIEQNPYILLDIAYGVDFKQIDKIAMDLGIEEVNGKRIESAIKYALIISSYNGHTCVIKENLIQYVIELIDVSSEYIENSIINLNAKNEIVIEKREKTQWIYLFQFYKSEQNVAKGLIKLNESKNTKKIKNFEDKLRIQEEQLDINLSEKQKEAIKAVNDNNVCIITGGPGTGKTTIIKCIINIYKEQKNKVVLCAPTGRAAKRMSEATNEEASTIHRLLELKNIEEEKLNNIDVDVLPIDADVIIIDEMSMVDIFLMNHMIKGIYKETKLVLVGDSDQLPSVGPGSVLKDIIESGSIETIELNKIFRQAAKSKIILNAHNVNNGISFTNRDIEISEEIEQNLEIDKAEELEDFFFIEENSQEKALKTVISLCTGRLKKYGNYDFFKNIQVLTPTKKGKLGTKELNKQLQEEINPHINGIFEKNNGDRIFRQGDKVMQIKNNYDIGWERIGTKESGLGIFNGELGKVVEIDEKNSQIQICFDDEKTAWYNYQDLEQIEHAYSMTIHKSQRK